VTTFSESEIEVLQSLAVRRQDLETREKRLSQREALLNAAEQEVDRKINELGALRDELTTLLDQQDKVQESRLNRMVKIYETMKPKDAAVIFNTLDMDVLLAVIGRMSERKSAPIFANMNPERSREVTIKLVEQGRLPALPKE
jgi:flagellar motility protein MotE (MotC chaperone)